MSAVEPARLVMVIGPNGSWRISVVAIALAAAFVNDAAVSSAVPAIANPVVNTDAEPARRTRNDLPTLSGDISHVAIVGDSMYFESILPGGRNSIMISLIRDRLRAGLGDPTVRLDNRSRPGLATLYPLTGPANPTGIALHQWITTTFRPGLDNPDLIVLPATSIDLNVQQRFDARLLAPLIVDEMRNVVDYLAGIGVQAVIVPAFGINDAMFDQLKSFGRPTPVRCEANARVKILNDTYASSDLPMLFTSFRGTDLDGDGDVDEENFTGFNTERFPDDGIHTNAVGDALIGSQIAARLTAAIAASGS